MGDKDLPVITIHSYQKVWGFEKLIFNVFGYRLPTPASENDAWYLLGSLMAVITIRLFIHIPLPPPIAPMLYYIGLPLGIMLLLRYKTFDGKNPVIFTIDYLHFFFADRSVLLEGFRHVRESPAHVTVWQVSYRHKLKRRLQHGK